MKNESVAEYLARGGKVKECVPGAAKGVSESRTIGVRNNSSRARCFRAQIRQVEISAKLYND